MKTVKALCIVMFAGLMVLSAQAKAVAIDTLTVSFASLAIDGITLSTPVTPPALITMGVYQDPILNLSANIPVLGLATATIYTSGLFGVPPAPSGTVNEPNPGNITVDLSSLRAAIFIPGLPPFLPPISTDISLWPLTTPPSMSSFYNNTTGEYNLDWSIGFNHGGSNHTATVSLAGVVTVVPVPAAIWLLVSGLLGLFAVGRRRC